jgi:hypothetical protein
LFIRTNLRIRPALAIAQISTGSLVRAECEQATVGSGNTREHVALLAVDSLRQCGDVLLSAIIGGDARCEQRKRERESDPARASLRPLPCESFLADRGGCPRHASIQ